MIDSYVVIGACIGIVFGMPIGAVGALCMQRTMNYGIYAGLITGLASSLVDLLYACVGAFGLTFISTLLLEYQQPINTIGALLLLIIAFRMMGRKEEVEKTRKTDAMGFLSMFLSSFTVAVANPAAVISFMFAFSVFGISGSLGLMDGIQLVLGIFIGTFFWWVLLSGVIGYMKQKCNSLWYRKANTFFAVILVIFSIGILLKTCSQ